MDAGYNKSHLDTLSGLAYFAAFELVEGERSIYVSNVHAVNAGFRAALTKRVDLHAGYSRVQDTGDGRDSPWAPVSGIGPGSANPLFLAVQTFPVTYQSPMLRASIELHPKFIWNIGYQYYHYRERFFTIQDYRAHTGYTSVVWSF